MVIATRKSGLKIDRKPGEATIIDERIKITKTPEGWVLETDEIAVSLNSGSQFRASMYVQAPRTVPVRRSELPPIAA